jgi:hypothetical protein
MLGSEIERRVAATCRINGDAGDAINDDAVFVAPDYARAAAGKCEYAKN